MADTGVSWRGTGAVLAALAIALTPGQVLGQAFPPTQPPSAQEAPPTGAGQPTPQQPGAPAQPPTPGPQPSGLSTQPIDPFAGSPLLQMFERQPDAAAPIRQSRFAPAPESGVPLSVRFFLTVEEEFTDNANQTKDNRKSEFSTRISPGISIGADRPWASFGLSYAPQVFIENNSIGETELNQSLSARAALWPEGRFRLNIAENFTDSNDFRDQQDPGSRLTGTDNYIENLITAEAAYVLPRFRTALAYENIINQTDVGFTDTRITHTVRPSAAYTGERFGLEGSYGVRRGNENSSVEIPYWSHLGDARISYAVTTATSAVLTGSYEYEEPDSGAHFSTGTGRVGGTFAFGPDGALTLLAGASVFSEEGQDTKVRPSGSLAYTHRFAAFVVRALFDSGFRNDSTSLDSTGVTFTRSAGIFVTSTQLLFRELTGTLGVRWTEEEFEQSSTFGGPPGTKDRTWDFDVSIRYALARSLFLGLGYTGTIRNSTQSSADFYENRVRLGLTYEYILF